MARESLTVVGYAGAARLHRRRAGAGVRDRGAAGRLPAGPAGQAAAHRVAPQPGGARTAVARRRRGVLRATASSRRSWPRAARRRSSAPPSDQLYRTNMSVTGVLSLLPPLMEALGGVAIVGALWYGSSEIAAGRLTPGEFTSFVAALLLMYGPIKKLTRVNANLQQAAAAAERVFELMDAHTEVVERPGAVAAAAVRPRHRVPRRVVRLRGRPRQAGAERRVVHGAGRTRRRHRRPQRRRQDHAGQPAAALLRRVGRRAAHRRPRRARRDAGVAAPADRRRHAGDGALRRHDRG